jgi:hypothetical protein
MAHKNLATLVAAALAVSLAYWGPAAAFEQKCAAIASFSGHSTKIELNLGLTGKPIKGSHVYYEPAGQRADMKLSVEYPMAADRMPEVTAPSFLEAVALVNPDQETGVFILTVGGQRFKSTLPGTVLLPYRDEWHGKVTRVQHFELSKPLQDALATGGPGQLIWVGRDGAAIAQVELSFASKAVIQSAVDKSYPTALFFAAHKDKC